MSEQIRNINLIIADRPYRLKISSDEEEKVRSAGKLIKEKIASFQQSYQAKDKQDYLAMTALTFCVDGLKAREDNTTSQNLENQLSELDQLLSVFLEKLG